MKKLLTLLAVFAVLSTALFAAPYGDDFAEREKYDAEKTTTKTIIPEDQHCTDKNGKVWIEYTPIHDELRIYYETLYVTFDKGEAMNTVMACLQDFLKEYKYYTYEGTTENGKRYYNYKYMEDDKVKYFKDDRGQRRTMYSAHVKLTR